MLAISLLGLHMVAVFGKTTTSSERKVVLKSIKNVKNEYGEEFPYSVKQLHNYLVSEKNYTSATIKKIKGPAGKEWTQLEKVLKSKYKSELKNYSKEAMTQEKRDKFRKKYTEPLKKIQSEINHDMKRKAISIELSNDIWPKISALEAKLTRHYFGFISVKKSNQKVQKKIEKKEKEFSEHNWHEFKRQMLNFPLYVFQTAPWYLLLSLILHLIIFGYWMWENKEFYIWRFFVIYIFL
ncbi:MAG: hypothetical protein ABEH43_00400, partial [Flavobacteriales bacterium]